MRGATSNSAVACSKTSISIHAPHAGRDPADGGVCLSARNFNPRAPCGARLVHGCFEPCFDEFQSTRPMRGATDGVGGDDHQIGISIHAPHAGRDPSGRWRWARPWNFNPRAPCGARPSRHRSPVMELQFQSTRPMRGATAKVYKITLHTFATKGNS